MIASLGGKLTQVVINELADETFFAKLIVDANGRHVEVDSRPSDAIALAIRAKVPIFVEDSVLDQAGMVFESEGDKDEADSEPKAVPPKPSTSRSLGSSMTSSRRWISRILAGAVASVPSASSLLSVG